MRQDDGCSVITFAVLVVTFYFIILFNAIVIPSCKVDLVTEPVLRAGPGNDYPVSTANFGGRFPVIGQAKASDGSMWWKLNDSREVWVAQGSVAVDGDCTNVPVVEPPPKPAARPPVRRTPRPGGTAVAPGQ
jgi:hypothetical protein